MGGLRNESGLRLRPGRMGRTGAFFLGCGLLTAMPVTAQETIASDRPGIGSGSAVIDAGVLQAEFGAAYLGGPGPDVVALGQLFVRYGLGRLELEVLGNSWVDVRSPDDVAAVDETTGSFKASSRSFWSNVTDGASVKLGGAASKPLKRKALFSFSHI